MLLLKAAEMKETNFQLSIIIPAFNEEKYLPRLLESIKNQDYQNFEIIVADANSKDRTAEIAKKYGCKVTKGGLPAAGRNSGAKIAKGKLLLFLDADVILPQQFLRRTVSEFIRRNAGVATCFMRPLTKKKTDIALHNFANYYMKITRNVYPHAPGFCIFSKKSIHDKIKGFNCELKLAEDHDYVRRASMAGCFKILRSETIPVSVRRFDKDGRLNVSAKYFLVELYRLFKGDITSDIFHYQFGHDGKNNKGQITSG